MWKEAAQKHPDFDTGSRLVHFSGKLEGPTFVSFPAVLQICNIQHQFFQKAAEHQHTNFVEGQMFQCHQIKETPES